MVRTDSHARRSFCETAGMTGWRRRPEHVLGPSFQHPWPRTAGSSGEAVRTVEGLIAATPWHPGPCWGHLPGACSPRDPNGSAGPDVPPNLRLLCLQRQKGPRSSSEQPPRYLGPCSSGASTSGQPRAWATDIEGLCPGAAPLGSEWRGQPSPWGPHLLGSQPLGWEGGGRLRPRGTPAPYV